MTDEGLSDLSTMSFHRGSRQKTDMPSALIMTVLTHPKLSMIGAQSVQRVLRGGTVTLSRTNPDFTSRGRLIGDPLGDPAISRKPITFQAAPENGLHLIRGSNHTSIEVDGTAIHEGLTLSSPALARGVVLSLSERVVLHLQRGAAPSQTAECRDLGMIGQGAAMAAIRSEIEKVASLDVPVLVRGETGTGKELVASALHRFGKRAGKPFVGVNLGALPHTLAAAELFGVRRGAFTGAHENKVGFIRAAHRGTLFLDEIGEAPLEVQAMLLRMLETRQVAPVGTHELVAVDLRLISATDADLETRIAAGTFKEPLLHRLSAYEILLPPLRERREDLGSLCLHFARETLDKLGTSGIPDRLGPHDPPWLPAELMARMACWHWPGNIRQLENVVRKLIIGNQGQSVLRVTPQVDRLLAGAPEPEPSVEPASRAQVPRKPRRKPREVSPEELEDALRRASWEPKAAADLLEIARSSIYDLIARAPGVHTAADLSPDQIADSYRRNGGDIEATARDLKVSVPALRRRTKAMGLTD